MKFVRGILIAAGAALALGGCGLSSQTRTVTVATSAPATPDTTPTATDSAPPPDTTPTTPNSGGTCSDHPYVGDCQKEAARGGTAVQCNDGAWSHAGGLPGACSHHGGESTASPGGTSAPDNGGPSASTSTPDGSAAVDAVNSYWQAINNGDFHTAYGYLASSPDSESTWVANHQADGIQSVSFSGSATNVGSTTATVHVDSLQTHDQKNGCQNWSGDYQMVNHDGKWLIDQAQITSSPC